MMPQRKITAINGRLGARFRGDDDHDQQAHDDEDGAQVVRLSAPSRRLGIGHPARDAEVLQPGLRTKHLLKSFNQKDISILNLIALKALAPLRLDALGATAHGDHSAAELALEAPQAHPLTVERLLDSSFTKAALATFGTQQVQLIIVAKLQAPHASQLRHTLGAASSIERVLQLQALRRGVAVNDASFHQFHVVPAMQGDLLDARDAVEAQVFQALTHQGSVLTGAKGHLKKVCPTP